ncbi:hypothetical protein AHAS_Ahas18G0175400 [Arachis hypogaea]
MTLMESKYHHFNSHLSLGHDCSDQWETATYCYYYPLSSGALDTHDAFSGCAKIMHSHDTQGQGTSTATGHSSARALKRRYDGAKCWHRPKPSLRHISQVFKENYNKPWLSFDEADDDTQKILWTEWRVKYCGQSGQSGEFCIVRYID